MKPQSFTTEMEGKFKNRCAIVTGAGSGMGRGVAKALWQSGAKVYAVSLLQTELDSLKLECPEINIVCVDLSDWAATEKAITPIGPVDLLVNCAGILTPGSILDFSEDNFDSTFNINVKAVMHVSKIVANSMLKSK